MGFGPFFHGVFELSRVPEYVHLHPIMATLAIIGFFALLFAFMDEFVNSVFWYLFADVVAGGLSRAVPGAVSGWWARERGRCSTG